MASNSLCLQSQYQGGTGGHPESGLDSNISPETLLLLHQNPPSEHLKFFLSCYIVGSLLNTFIFSGFFWSTTLTTWVTPIFLIFDFSCIHHFNHLIYRDVLPHLLVMKVSNKKTGKNFKHDDYSAAQVIIRE